MEKAMADQLERIESKLDKIGERLSVIEAHDAADLERFTGVHDRIDAVEKARASAIALMCTQCGMSLKIDTVKADVDAIRNRAIGASWTLGKVIAVMAGLVTIAGLIVNALKR